MKQDISEKLNLAVDKFLDNLFLIEKNMKEEEQTLVDEIKKCQSLQKDLDAQAKNNDYHLKVSRDKLNEERSKQIDLNNSVRDEISKYNKLSNELAYKISEAKENLDRTKIESELISKSLKAAKDKETDYNLKIHSLKKDSDEMIFLKATLQDREKQFAAKERLLQKKEEQLIERENNLNYLDTELKVRETEVSRLIKRYKLEESLKVK